MELTRKIRDRMTRRNIMFFYRGVVTSVNSISLLMLLEKEMEGAEFGFVGKKRLFMFVLESLQNISRHAGRDRYADMSLVAYSKSDSGYTVSTGNVMDSSHVPDLRKRLKQINALDPDDVRKVYRKMLDESEISDKGGAGLGLIEIAKKTGNKLDYDFVKLDEEHHYYILSKTVDESGQGKNVATDGRKFSGLPLIRLERLLSKHDIYMVWSNHITPDVGKEMLSFTETKLREDEVHAGVKRRVFSILVEVLENVAKYSPGKRAEKKLGMPVAIIKMEGKDFIISTGNLIANNKIKSLRNKLDMVNSYDKAGLKELYRLRLSQQSELNDSTGSMGLIDIARKSGNPLEYSFEKITSDYSYFIIQVRVDDQSTD